MLLRLMDTQAKLSLQAQVAVAHSTDAFLSLLHLFRTTLASIPLPPPSAVDLTQALKDAQRETIVLNGTCMDYSSHPFALDLQT